MFLGKTKKIIKNYHHNIAYSSLANPLALDIHCSLVRSKLFFFFLCYLMKVVCLPRATHTFVLKGGHSNATES